MISALTTETFDSAVFESSTPVLVDFYATWCGPCRMLAPVLEELAEAAKGKASIYKVDVDAQPALAERFRILSIPTLVLVKDGKIQTRIEGGRSLEDLKELLGV